MDVRPSFEETYPNYPFAPLVRAGLVAGRWILRMLHLAKAPRRSGHDSRKARPRLANSGCSR
jgi:hypothetical protein